MKLARIVAAIALAAAFAAQAQAANYASSPVAVESLPDITPIALPAKAAVEIAALAAPGAPRAFVAASRKTGGFEARMLARPALAGFVSLVLGATLLQLRRTWRNLEARRFGQA